MLFAIILVIIIGITLGIFTGLTPGIHINLVALLVVSSSPFLLQHTSPLILSIGIIAMSVTHTFIDTIPGIYLGAPDESQALAALPGHRMLLQGKGHEAVALTVIGSLFALILALLAVPVIMKAIILISPLLEGLIGFILIIVMYAMIRRETSLRKQIAALLLFVMSGTLGIIVLHLPLLTQPLFPLLSGLFGISLLLLSITQQSTPPQQERCNNIEVTTAEIKEGSVAATIVGCIAAFLPGFGSSQACILAAQFMKQQTERAFMVLVGGVNTVNMAISIITIFILDKARNGAILAVGKLVGTITLPDMLSLLTTALIAGGVATILCLMISIQFSKLISRVNYTTLVLAIIFCIIALTLLFDGWLGALVLLTSTSIGVIAGIMGAGKNHLMGCLVLPVIFFFL